MENKEKKGAEVGRKKMGGGIVAFTLGTISRRDVAARCTLKMGYKEINRVVYTRRDMA